MKNEKVKVVETSNKIKTGPIGKAYIRYLNMKPENCRAMSLPIFSELFCKKEITEDPKTFIYYPHSIIPRKEYMSYAKWIILLEKEMIPLSEFKRMITIGMDWRKIPASDGSSIIVSKAVINKYFNKWIKSGFDIEEYRGKYNLIYDLGKVCYTSLYNYYTSINKIDKKTYHVSEFIKMMKEKRSQKKRAKS